MRPQEFTEMTPLVTCPRQSVFSSSLSRQWH